MEPFYQVISKVNVISIMEPYNECYILLRKKNKELLIDIITTKFWFKSFIMSDWLAINSNDYQNFTIEYDMN